jgi:hypothetical protein
MNVEADVMQSWLKFLDPQSLRSNLILASIYLAAWETFEHGVIGNIESFYLNGFDENSFTYSEGYQQAMTRDKSPFRASMLWFKDMGIVDAADMELADRPRQHRNDIAHNLPAYLAKASHNVDVALLGDLCSLLSKIDAWWIRNVEIPINSDFDYQDVDAIPDAEIKSGNMLFLSMMFNIATGDETEASELYNEFVRISEASGSALPA